MVARLPALALLACACAAPAPRPACPCEPMPLPNPPFPPACSPKDGGPPTPCMLPVLGKPDAVGPLDRFGDRLADYLERIRAAEVGAADLADAARRLDAAEEEMAAAESAGQRRRARVDWIRARSDLRAALKGRKP